LVGSNEALSRNVELVEERMMGSLRDLLRAFTLNPAACDAVLRDDSLLQERSESANEIIRQLKVSVWAAEETSQDLVFHVTHFQRPPPDPLCQTFIHIGV